MFARHARSPLEERGFIGDANPKVWSWLPKVNPDLYFSHALLTTIRLTPGVGYLEALVEDNVTVIGDSILKFTANGVVTEKGVEIKADVIICATGFDTSYRPSFKVTGKQGQDLNDIWIDKPQSYLSIAVSGFPNYFSTVNFHRLRHLLTKYSCWWSKLSNSKRLRCTVFGSRVKVCF